MREKFPPSIGLGIPRAFLISCNVSAVHSPPGLATMKAQMVVCHFPGGALTWKPTGCAMTLTMGRVTSWLEAWSTLSFSLVYSISCFNCILMIASCTHSGRKMPTILCPMDDARQGPGCTHIISFPSSVVFLAPMIFLFTLDMEMEYIGRVFPSISIP